MPAYLTPLAATSVLLLLAAPAWTAAEQARARAGEVLLHEVPASEGATMQALFFAAAPPATVRAVLSDYARYPEFIPHARTSKVLEQHGDDAVVEQSGGSGPFTMTFTTKRHREAHRITWTTIGGGVRQNEGFWQFDAAPGGTLITYQVHVVPKGPVPQRITAMLEQHSLPEMCEAVRARVQRSPAR